MMEINFASILRQLGSNRRRIWYAILATFVFATGAYFEVCLRLSHWNSTGETQNELEPIPQRAFPATGVEETTTDVLSGSDVTTISEMASDVSDGCIKVVKKLINGGIKFNATNDNDRLPICQKDRRIVKHEATRHKEAVVPNIAHFIWFYDPKPLRFDQFISILSAHTVMKADKIMFHTVSEPYGRYWDILKETVDVLEVVHTYLPKFPGSNRFHKADLKKLNILLQYGGVYLDHDVIVVKSLEPLRHYDFVMGREQPLNPDYMNNGVILANKNSQFLEIFRRGYDIMYTRECWACDSILYPNALAIQFPDLIHVEEKSFHYMYATHTFEGHFPWWEEHYTVHTFVRPYLDGVRDINEALQKINLVPRRFEQDVKTLNTSFGEMARYVLYGTKP